MDDYKQLFLDLICSKQKALDKVMNNKFIPKNYRRECYNNLKAEIDLLLMVNKLYVMR